MLRDAQRLRKLFLLFSVQQCVWVAAVNQPANHFQLALKSFLKEEEVSARAFAQQVGVNNSLISRLDAHRVDSDSLAKMLRYFPHERQVALLRAHLWDEVIRAGIDPDAVWASLVDGDLAWLAKLPASAQADLEVIASEIPTNSGIRFSVTGIAESILRGRAEDADRDRKVYALPEFTAQLAAEDAPARKSRKNTGAPTARPSLPPKPKAS